MPPKKKSKETRNSTEIFLVGQPRASPLCMSKPLTNGDFIRFLHYKKGLEQNKNIPWDKLISCARVGGTANINCDISGCKASELGGYCGVSFAKETGGWLKTGLPLKSEKSSLFKDWQNLHKRKSRLNNTNLSANDAETVREFKKKMDSTLLITDNNAEDIIRKDKLRDQEQKDEDLLFLKSMKVDRIASVSSNDKVYEERIKRKEQRNEDERRRQTVHLERKNDKNESQSDNGN